MPAPRQSLPFALNQVSLQQRGELPVLQISNRHADATIALQGAQLLEYTPRGQQPVIWLSEHADYQRGQSVRGGVPICWPWFGAIERNPDAVRAMTRGDNLPAHGLVRSRDWTLQSVREEETFTEVTLAFSADHWLQQQWPHAADLALTVKVGQTLNLQLSTHNAGTEPLTLTQALHTYFAVSAIENVTATGFENSRYIDTLADWREQSQSGPIRFDSETDSIYLDLPNEVELLDSGWNRTIVLRATGSTSAVVWNPWIEKSKRLSQFSADAWRAMACIETANVLDNAVLLPPRATHCIELNISTTSAP